jgi:hypothetical protein
MNKTLLVLILIAQYLFGLNLTGGKVFLREGREVLIGCSSKITSNNLDNILEEAVLKGRILEIDKYRLYILYSNINNGSNLLKKCLNIKKCNPYEFVTIAKKSELHKIIVSRYPHLTLSQVNQKVGFVNEFLMNKYFTSTGWKKIEGEVGRNGIDGLFVKTKNGKIVDVLIAESKYNKSQLGNTKYGRQMTKEWALKKIDDLIKKYPDNVEYITIKRHIENDNYRALLWQMKLMDNRLNISLKKLQDHNGNIVKEELRGSYKMKINYSGNQQINLINPENSFHKKMAEWYQEALEQI